MTSSRHHVYLLLFTFYFLIKSNSLKHSTAFSVSMTSNLITILSVFNLNSVKHSTAFLSSVTSNLITILSHNFCQSQGGVPQGSAVCPGTASTDHQLVFITANLIKATWQCWYHCILSVGMFHSHTKSYIQISACDIYYCARKSSWLLLISLYSNWSDRRLTLLIYKQNNSTFWWCILLYFVL